jgi:predicted tellurium resistance membrane protein TerC
VAFGQVVAIDLVLACDNAIVVGMVAAAVPIESRRKIIGSA